MKIITQHNPEDCDWCKTINDIYVLLQKDLSMKHSIKKSAKTDLSITVQKKENDKTE